MVIRRYKPGEEAEIWALYFDTTHRIVAKQYAADQVRRWAPPDADMTEWARRLAVTRPFVAVENGQIVGFAELEDDGHIGNFYCHHARQRRGIGTALLRVLEEEAAHKGIPALHAEVSTTAVAFFRAQGFEVTEERAPLVCGMPARQFLMRKSIRT